MNLERREDIIFIRINKLIRRRSHIISRSERDGTFWEFTWKIILLIKRIGHRTTVVIFLAVPSTGIITRQEEVRIKIRRSLSTESCSQSINEVGRNHRVDRTDIHLAGRLLCSRLNEILNKGTCSEDSILKSANLLQVMDKLIHPALALRQFHLSVLFPEGFILHHGISHLHLFLFALE